MATESINEPGKAREAFRGITRDVAWVAEAPKPHKAWLGALAVSVLMLGIGVYSIYVLLANGIGVWGNSNTVGWAWDITVRSSACPNTCRRWMSPSPTA